MESMNIDACAYGDFELGLDDNGIEFVELKLERGTKHTGGDWQQERAFNPRMYAIGGGSVSNSSIQKVY